ncbi:MAG: glutaredoxin 3 [Miltoncostaeaceae bacterium]
MSAPTIRMYTSASCPYCVRAKRLLDAKGVEFEEIHLGMGDPGARIRMSEETGGRMTVPQILVDDRPLGGFDDIKALDDRGELDALLGIG